jgi:hypothetical protein
MARGPFEQPSPRTQPYRPNTFVPTASDGLAYLDLGFARLTSDLEPEM